MSSTENIQKYVSGLYGDIYDLICYRSHVYMLGLYADKKETGAYFVNNVSSLFSFALHKCVPILRSTTHPASLKSLVRFVWLRILTETVRSFLCAVFNYIEYGT